jgi:hypothetical protein
MSCKQEFDEKLIDCVRNFSVIYDPSKKAKDDAWKSMAAA